MDLHQSDLAGEGLMCRSTCPGHGLDAIGFADDVFEIGIADPGEAVVAPLRAPAVHEQEATAIFPVVISHHALCVAAEAEHGVILLGRLPEVFAHQGLYIAAADLHTDDHGCA